jgi:hypothetical protein
VKVELLSNARLKLTVSSDHGSLDPSVGITTYDEGAQISCKVTSPVTEGLRVWACKGWSGTGSAPASGEGTNVTFPLNEDSTITWNWKPTGWYYGTVGAQVGSCIAFALVTILAVWSYESQYVLMTAVWAGAIGGLIHEIVQSQGKFMLPNTDDKGNLCLGGLIGIISGGVAGLIYYQGLTTITAITIAAVFVGAFIAGLALKGVADAVNPPSKQSS